MKLSKRILACLLCLVMVVGLFPAAVQAADEPTNASINFLDPASADKFTVVNQKQTKIVEGEGLYFITTRPAMEPCNGQNTGDQATTPEDLVTIPVTGDEWTATIKFKFSTNGARNGYYQFFGFYAAEGDDYQNMAGIRGGDGALQDFIRIGGEVTAEQNTSSPGLSNETTYWYQIEKAGTTYTCNRSSDGLTFTKMFSFEDTGINADNLIIDAYTGMTEGYVCNVEYLAFGDVVAFELNNAVETVLSKIPVAPEKIPTKKADDTFKLPKAPSGTTVTYTAEPDCIVDGKLVGTGATDTNVKLTVNITAAGQTVTKVLDIIVPAKGAGTADPTVYTVTFNPNVSGMSAVEVPVEEGDTVEVPASMNRVGYAATWRSGNTTFDFNTPITQNITLTASWTKDWNQMYSLAEEYADYFPFGTFGTMSPGAGQTEREYCTYSGNNGKMTYNFDANGSRNTYNSTVNAINADSSLTQEEKDEKIFEAEGKVQVSLNGTLVNALRSIQNWNNSHPEGPKKYFRQHVIAWHGSEQNQAFYHLGFDTSKDWATREIMNARLDSYIENYFKLCEPYKDVILSWDIVNEALDCYTGMVRNHDDSSSQKSEWGHIYRYYKDGKAVGLDGTQEELDERLYVESEWIRVAFASARKWANEIGAEWKLYYNDYHDSNKLYEPKLHNTIKVLQPIYEAGNIDGYGMQARVAFACPTAEFIAEHIDLGLTVADEFSFSEADFRSDFVVNPNYDPGLPTRRVTADDGDTDWNAGGSGRYSTISQNNGNTYDVWNSPVRRNPSFNNSNIDEETKRLQADYVADIMDYVLERRDQCGAIAIDGTNDGSTFNNGTGCQLWDTSGNEKPSFFAAIGAPNRLKMREAIAAGPSASKKSQYTADSWDAYETAKAAAEALVDVRIYDSNGVEAVKEATANLNAAIDGLVRDGDAPAPVTETIDFTNPDDASKFEIVNNTNNIAIAEGVGLTLTTTMDAFEPCGGAENTSTTPSEVIEISVSGDWTATLSVDFSAGSAANGYYQFLGFYASEGDDYQNMAGIRGGDKHMQDFLRQDGAIVTDTDGIRSEPGFDTEGKTYYLRIEKIGTTYTCYRSEDGEDFVEMFSYEDTGIEADKIVIDAYTGMTEGYQYTLNFLDIESDGEACDHTRKEIRNAKEATCTEAGYTGDTYCKDCGKRIKKGQEIAALGHDWDGGKVTTEPTCGKAGVKTYTCKRAGCTATKTESIPATGEHTWGDWAVTTPAGTLTVGEETRTCSVCGATETREIPMLGFEDVDPETYYYEAVYWAVANGITTGTDETHFSPDKDCTRAQAVMFLWNAAGKPEVAANVTNPFTDVKEDRYYYNAVLWAVSKGITTGTTATTFSPNAKLDRATFVTFLWRAMGKPEVEDTGKFTDVKEGKYYTAAIAWAVSEGITDGKTDTTFAPADLCTRAQVVVFLHRAYH